MSTNSGIFESFPSQPQNRQDSPFSVAPQEGGTPASPFTTAARKDSPFSVVDEVADSKAASGEASVKLPERRKQDSPFQMAEPSEGFGLEVPAKASAASPLESGSSSSAPAASPLSAPAQSVPSSPFAIPDQKSAESSTPQAAIAAFTDWKEPAAAASSAAPTQVPSAFASPAPDAPAQQPAPAAQPQITDSQSDSFNIRQLELRAIFGVDREMNADEILKRAKALPGIRNLAKLSSQDMATLEAVKKLLPSLGFANSTLKIYADTVPLEFIREGSVMLSVQTDGGFAPGVRETIMIVARELGRLA